MAEEVITILKVGTDEAVKSVNDLKNNVKILKENLGDLEIGTKEYQDTLEELKVNQAAVKDAMYATTASMDDLTKAATGTSESYNSLVHRMASLKEELRATDVSTEQGKARFKELATEINNVNDKLKDMDALQGNFQRNVGNYPGLMKNFAGALDNLDKGLKVTEGGVMGLKGGFEALSVSPVIAILGMLLSLFNKLAAEIKSNENAMAGVQKLGMALEPMFKFFQGILQNIVDIVVSLAEKVSVFVQSNGLVQKVINGVIGVGNAIVKYLVAPVKGVIAAIKVFQDEGIKGLRNAAKAFADEMKTGVSFKSNYEAGAAIVDAVNSGIKDKKQEAVETAKEVGTAVGQEISKYALADFEKALAEGDRVIAERKKAMLEEQKALDALAEEEMHSALDMVDAYYDEEEKRMEENMRKAEEMKKVKIDTMMQVANSTSSILGSIADMYESDEESSEKNAKKIKALRIASATLDTISGALSAFMSVWKSELPLTAKMITAPITSASVLAAGMAQIAQIKNTNVSASASASTGSVSAISSAPIIPTEVANVRSVTSASEEERLNQMASEQRVYILSSDIEASQNAIKTQVAEASF